MSEYADEEILIDCKNRNSYEVNRLRYFRRNLVRSLFLIDIEIRSFLKHNVHKRSLSFEETVMYNIFHEMLCYSQITRTSVNVFFFIFISRNIFSANVFKILSNQQNRARRLIHVKDVTCDHNLFLYQTQDSSKSCHCWFLLHLKISIRSSRNHQRTAIRFFSFSWETNEIWQI